MSEKVILIPNGIEMNGTRARPPLNLRRRYCWPSQDRIVAMIGHLEPLKRHPDFIEAVAKVRDRYPRCKFAIFGHMDAGPPKRFFQPYWESLRRLRKALKLENDLAFVRGLDDLTSLLDQIDVVCHPSPDEGFPNGVLEAMSRGKPVIVVNEGGTGELVSHRETGLLVPPARPDQLAKAILELLEDPKLAQALGKAAYEEVKKRYDIRRVAAQYASLFEEIISRRLHTHVAIA